MCRRLFFAIFMLMAVGAAAQHPFSLDWRVLKTPHAKFIYPSYLGYDVARLAGGIDEVVKADTANIGLLPRRMPVVLSATSNTSNGYTTLAPYKMVLYTRPMGGTELGSAEWFQNLITHEYRHIVQYRMFDRGLTKAVHSVFGSLGWSAMMYSVPQWFYEGDAVYAESVLSSQGRGRVASFEMPISALLQDRNSLFPYDKMIHRSYRDMIPNHYPIGYMLVTGAKRDFGADVFNKIAKRQSWYAFWPFAFGCGFRHFTDERLAQNYKKTFSSLKDYYRQRAQRLGVHDYGTVNNTQRRIYTDYESPCVIDDNKIVCVKTSMSKAARFVVLDTLGREVDVLGHTDADCFDTDGNIIVYITEVPDIRWTERSFSDIAVFDIKSKTCQIVTNKCKYDAIAISDDGRHVVVVDFSDERICKLVVLSLTKNGGEYSAQVVSSYYSRPMEFFRSPKFADDNHVVFVSNYGNQNSIRSLDLNSMTVAEVTAYSPENIPEVCPDGDNVYYVSDINGIDNIHRVPLAGGKSVQVTNVKYGVKDVWVEDKKVYFSSYGSKGYDVAWCGVNEVVSDFKQAHLKYFEPLLSKEPSAVLDPIATRIPDTTVLAKSKKYHQYSDPFRFIGWMPNSDESQFNITAYTANNLGTLNTTVSETYYKDPGYWRTDVDVEYSGFYPVITLGASLGDNGDNFPTYSRIGRFTGYVDYVWRENIYSASISLPLNLSRLWYSQSLRFSTGLYLHDISGKPIADYLNLPDGNFTVWSGSASYSWARHAAYRDFKSPLSLSISAGVKRSLSGPVDASMAVATASLTVPGLFRQNYLTITGTTIRQDQCQSENSIYLYDHTAFDVPGYSSVRMQNFSGLSAEYSFPMGYPDFGIPSLVWFKRLRGGITGDVAYGELFRQGYDYASAGFKVLVDFCVLRLNYNITVGMSVAKGLKNNGLEGTETGVILALPL